EELLEEEEGVDDELDGTLEEEGMEDELDGTLEEELVGTDDELDGAIDEEIEELYGREEDEAMEEDASMEEGASELEGREELSQSEEPFMDDGASALLLMGVRVEQDATPKDKAARKRKSLSFFIRPPWFSLGALQMNHAQGFNYTLLDSSIEICP
ncbi:MAG: hypothetical protein J6328_03720, partial [Bacilli bacterium]|nr:hypothetical protein [Bacilli bacterium]